MARGPKKSLDDKIIEKKDIIDSLKQKLLKEENELKDFIKTKKELEIFEITSILSDANISVEEAREILKHYVSSSQQQTA